MNKTVKMVLIFSGALTAIAAASLYIYHRHHKVDEVEPEPIPEDMAKYCDNDILVTEAAWKDLAEDPNHPTGIPLGETPKDIIAENYSDEIVEEPKPKYDIPPYQIGQEAFLSNDPNYEKVVLWWDSELDVFSNELDIIEYDVKTKLGEMNIKRFKADDQMSFMYIRNENLEKDYELVK